MKLSNFRLQSRDGSRANITRAELLSIFLSAWTLLNVQKTRARLSTQNI